MGRTRIIVPKGKYLLRSVSKKSDIKSIYLKYVFKRETITRSAFNYKCRDCDWNQNGNLGRGEVRASYGCDYKRVNATLAQKIADIDNTLVEYNNLHPNRLTVQIVRDIIDGKPLTRKDGGLDFIKFVNDITENKYGEGRISYSTYKNRRCNMSKFLKFLKSKKKSNGIFIGDVKKEIISEYIQWRKEIESNCVETINHSLTPIIYGCERAADLGYMPKSEYADIKNMRLPKMVSFNMDIEEDSVKYLEKEELRQVKDFYNLDTEKRRREYIEMFLFSFYACGLRLIDIMTLQWKHIDFEKKELAKILIKTANYRQNTHRIPLTDSALEILKSWKKKTGNNRFVFGLLAEDFDLDNKEALYKRRNTVDKSINQSLAVVGLNLKFANPLTMHVARHSFAVMALNDGRPMTVVSRLLGHASSMVTEKVYAKYLPRTLEAEVNKLDFGFLAN